MKFFAYVFAFLVSLYAPCLVYGVHLLDDLRDNAEYRIAVARANIRSTAHILESIEFMAYRDPEGVGYLASDGIKILWNADQALTGY